MGLEMWAPDGIERETNMLIIKFLKIEDRFLG